MKVSEIFEGFGDYKSGASYAPHYDPTRGIPSGAVADWLDAMGIKPADVKEAIVQIKKTPEFKALADQGIIYTPNANGEKNGTLAFKTNRTYHYNGRDNKFEGQYLIHANGLIRVTSNGGHGRARLKSPKPRFKPGSPVESVVMMYSAAIKELLNKKKRNLDKPEAD